MTDSRVIRIGTRKSPLAMYQAELVQSTLQELFPKTQFEVVAMSTTGDKILEKALNKIGEKSLFTKELEVELEARNVDLIVHSLKDLPSTLPPNMVIGAIMKREDPRDVLIMRKDLHESGTRRMSELPVGTIIATGAVRRAAQFRANFPDFKYHGIRGNLNTRLKKLDNKGEGEDYSAMILAAAGVHRLGWSARISQYIEMKECMHAIGQGALGIECLQGDVEVLEILSKLNHVPTLVACTAERALMRKLEGGCSAPVAGHAEISEGQELVLKAGVWSLDGTDSVVMEDKVSVQTPSDVAKMSWDTQKMFASVSGHVGLHEVLNAAASLGDALGQKMLEKGAGEILKAAKEETERIN